MCPVSLPCPDLVCLVFFGQIRPFSGDRKDMLHFLDMTSSVVLFLTLWAGSVFTTFPRCIDMKDMQSTTSTLGWCDGLSVVVGLVVIGFIGVLVACFVWFQVYAKNPKPKEGATADAMDAVELVEQTTMEDDDGDIYEGGGRRRKENLPIRWNHITDDIKRKREKFSMKTQRLARPVGRNHLVLSKRRTRRKRVS